MIHTKNILAKEGYLISKKHNDKYIDDIKKELTVAPFVAFNKNIKPKPFTVYLENDKYLCIPKYYGIEKFGLPNKNKEVIGDKIDIVFNGSMRPQQIEILDHVIPKLEEKDGGLLCLGCGSGKCLGYDTEILMYNGTIQKVQNINIGDKLMGDDSKMRTVLSITTGLETMYKIYTDYSYYIVNQSHILSLMYYNNIVDITVYDYLNLPLDEQKLYFGYRVPIRFSEKLININPYIYGTQIIDKIEYDYKCNSRENQLLLLAGIIDTFGYIKNNIYIVENNLLIDDIDYICKSLGFLTFKTKCKLYILKGNLIDIPVLKVEKSNIIQNHNDLLYCIKIENIGIDKYYGFEINGNRRFLLNDFTVTHNTVCALYIAVHFKVKTLVIVHKSFLLNQWIQRAKEFTNANIGIIQQNKIDIDGKDIVIGMLQSIAKDKYESDIFRDFGLVIFDEAHHAPSNYFSRALPIISCKKTLALSATPYRTDKLEKVLFWYFGDILYKAPIEKLNNVLVKFIKYNINHPHFKEYKMSFGTDINRPKTINKLVNIDMRNQFIINTIKDILEEDKRKLLILSDRVEHLNQLKYLLEDYDCSLYIGGLKQKILDLAEKAQIIFATYSMASEALDIPDLNTLIMVTPRKEIEQAIGRITRRKDHPVQPMVIDIIDQLPIFVRQSYHRKKFYYKKGFIIKIIEVEENHIINEIDNNNIIDLSNVQIDTEITDDFLD